MTKSLGVILLPGTLSIHDINHITIPVFNDFSPLAPVHVQ